MNRANGFRARMASYVAVLSYAPSAMKGSGSLRQLDPIVSVMGGVVDEPCRSGQKKRSSPLAASMPMCNLRQARRFAVPCFSKQPSHPRRAISVRCYRRSRKVASPVSPGHLNRQSCLPVSVAYRIKNHRAISSNPMVETFFKTLKAELVWRTIFQSRIEAAIAIGRYIDGFYNVSSEHTSRYVVDAKRLCWATSCSAGCFEDLEDSSASLRAVGPLRSGRLKTQGPSGRGWIVFGRLCAPPRAEPQGARRYTDNGGGFPQGSAGVEPLSLWWAAEYRYAVPSIAAR